MSLFSLGKTNPATETSRLRLSVSLTLVFLVLAGIGAWRHELWRDEMQAWLNVRDAPNLSALLEEVHYNGAPSLWYLLLRPLALLTFRPEAMQILTWILAGATVFVFVHFAPFNRLQKALLVCNYYLLFEYGIVCRNYLPGILGLGIACVLFPRAEERPWPFIAALLAAALASVHSLIVAVALAGGFWAPRCFRWGPPKDAGAGSARFQAGPLLCFAGGLAYAVYSMLPRADTLYPQTDGWILDWVPIRLARVASAVVNSCFTWPRPAGFSRIPPWDTPTFSIENGQIFIWALLLFVLSVLFFKRHAGALVLYVVGTVGVAAFFYVKYIGAARHAGLLFFTFLFAQWIKQASRPRPSPGSSAVFDRWASVVLTAMLAAQAVTGVWALKEDFNQRFSCGKAAAQILQERHLDRGFIAVAPDWAGAPLAGYLNRSLYYPNARGYGRATHWDKRRTEFLEDDEIMRRTIEEANGQAFVISFEHPLAKEFTEKYGLETVADVVGSMTPFEDYHLFYRPGKAAAGASPESTH
jgi:hypothetical protein